MPDFQAAAKSNRNPDTSTEELTAMDIHALFDEAVKEADAFENHPAGALPLDQQILYLKALSLVMSVDRQVSDPEKEYLRILIKSFQLDETMLTEIVDFATSADKDTIQEFIRTFRRRPIAQVFLFDAFMMARRDGAVDASERSLAYKFGDHLEILPGTQRDIYDLFCQIVNRNWEESSIYFSSHLLNPQHFKHLLDYHEVDLDELKTRTEAIRLRKLQEILQSKIIIPDVTWGKLSYTQAGLHTPDGDVSKAPVILNLPNDVVLHFLQSLLDRRLARAHAGKLVVSPDGKSESEFLIDIAARQISYNAEDSALFLKDPQSAQPDTSLPEELIRLFVGADKTAAPVEVIVRYYLMFGLIPVFAVAKKNFWRPKCGNDFVDFIPHKLTNLSDGSNLGIYALDTECGFSWVLGDKTTTISEGSLSPISPGDNSACQSDSSWTSGKAISVCRKKVFAYASTSYPIGKSHQLESVPLSMLLRTGVHVCRPASPATINASADFYASKFGFSPIQSQAPVNAAEAVEAVTMVGSGIGKTFVSALSALKALKQSG